MRRIAHVLLPAALVLTLAGPALSQVRRAVEDPEANLVDELVVTARLRGPAWWRVRDADTTVYILGVPESRLPPGVAWDRTVTERRLKGASQLFVGTRVNFKARLRDAPALLRARQRVRSKTPMENTLPPNLRTRFVAARQRLGTTEGRYDDWQPMVAGMMLLGDAFDRKGWMAVDEQVKSMARRAEAPVRSGPKYAALPVVNTALAGLTPRAQTECLEAALDDVEAGAEPLRRSGQAWARGDIPAAVRGPRAFNACLLAIAGGTTVWRNMVRDNADAISASLATPGHSVAIVNLRALLAEDGVIERLEAKGLQVMGPGDAE